MIPWSFFACFSEETIRRLLFLYLYVTLCLKKGDGFVDPKEFGAFIQTRRKELGMNQTQLAEKLYVTAKAVSRWERGVGFPSIELLQPLADALEISIAELMQSKLLEKDLPKEEAAQLVTQTVETIRRQEALTWKRKLLLYGGYGVFLLIYFFLYHLGMDLSKESFWTGLILTEIGVFVWWFGNHALRSLLTGEPFHAKTTKKNWKHRAASAVFFAGIIMLLGARTWIDSRKLRDFLSVFGLMMSFVSGCYMTIFEEELSK